MKYHSYSSWHPLEPAFPRNRLNDKKCGPYLSSCLSPLANSQILEPKSNVQRTVKRLRTASEPTLVNPIKDGKVRVVGAYYSLENGEVEFFDV